MLEDIENQMKIYVSNEREVFPVVKVKVVLCFLIQKENVKVNNELSSNTDAIGDQWSLTMDE